jgi:hypothetical protein
MAETILDRTDLHLHIWREFSAMPGHRLTLRQACRLFGGRPREVAETLQNFIDAGVLQKIGPYYVRSDWSRFTA